MNIVSLASGSKGNSMYVGANGVNILIDVGTSMKKINLRLMQYVGIEVSDIDIILITHAHIDHVQSLHTILNKNEHIKVISHKDVFQGYLEKHKKHISTSQKVYIDNVIKGNQVDIKAHKLNHDEPCYGYSIHDKSSLESFLFIADNGGIPFKDWEKYKGFTYYAIESNHDLTLEINHPNRELLTKRRSLSYYGHTDNKTAMDFAMQVVTQNTKGIIFHHLSEDCNSLELISETHNNLIQIWGNVRLFKDIKIVYAEQEKGVVLV